MSKAKAKPELDPDLVMACEALTLDAATVLAFNVYPDRVVVVAPDGRKLEVER